MTLIDKINTSLKEHFNTTVQNGTSCVDVIEHSEDYILVNFPSDMRLEAISEVLLAFKIAGLRYKSHDDFGDSFALKILKLGYLRVIVEEDDN